jgi:hypothetical protein
MGNNEREIGHIEDRVEDGMDYVVVACRNPSVREKLKDRLEDSEVDGKAVEFCLVKDLLDLESFDFLP